MRLFYKDTLVECTVEHYQNLYSLSDIQRTLTGNEYVFVFRVIPDLPDLRNQALYFARWIAGLKPMNNPLIKTSTARNYQELVTYIQEAYVYSALKPIFYGLRMYSGGFNLPIKMNTTNLLFQGHQLLYNTISQKFIILNDQINNTRLIKRVDLYQDDLEYISSDPVWIETVEYDPNGYEFYNPRLEAILYDIKYNYPEISINNMSDFTPDTGSNPMENPVGNTCVKVEIINEVPIQVGFYYTSVSSIADMSSKFWSLAVGISIDNDTDEDLTDAVYSFTSSLDDQTIKYKVQSITGVLYGSGHQYSRSRPEDDTLPLGSPSPGNSSSTSLSSSSSLKPKNNNKRGAFGSRKTSNSNTLSSKIGKAANSIGNTIKGTVTSEKFKNLVTDVIREAGIKAADAATKSLAASYLIETFGKRGLQIESDGSEVNSGLPLLKYEQNKSSKTMKLKDENDNK